MTHNELNFQSIKVFGLVFLIMVLGISFSCNSGKQPTTETTKDSIIQSPPTEVVQPEWAYSANIYELNIRQFTKEGTFKALDPHLARLKEMGVDIIWLMPINPIGKKNRKGTLGSYYSVKDYMTVNPEYGTLDDFKTFVAKAHELGLKVIIDWVPNHSSWDNVLTVKHPDFYVRDEKGKFLPPVADWSDVIELNYDNPTMRKFMVDAMQYWIKETDIDGYRCDVAHGVPNDFWDDLRPALDSIKPVFMLAEAEIPEQQYKAFNMSYSWELHHIIHQIAKGEKNLMSLDTYFVKQKKLYPVDAYRMNFTTNHDEKHQQGKVSFVSQSKYRAT